MRVTETIKNLIKLTFKPESKEFEDATEEYQQIWGEEKEKILGAFEKVTSLKFKQKSIDVVVYEGPSFSGNLKRPMKLRSSYSNDVKKGTLVHELGHRLIAPMHNRMKDIDEHRTLNLFLYDVWVYLYGKRFADEMVAIEQERKGLYDYKSAWCWFFELSEEKKNLLWKEFLKMNPDRDP